MIRLTLNAKFDPEIHLFTKSTIVVGKDASLVDLPLNAPYVLPIHLKIILESNHYYAINETNDPFVLIDGQPFKKKLLLNGSILFIHDTELLFEVIEKDYPDSGLDLANQSGKGEIQKSKEAPPLSSIELPFENEIHPLEGEEWKEATIDKYFKEFETVEDKTTATAKSKGARDKVNSSIKDDYLKDLDDDNRTNPFFTVNDPEQTYQAWKWVFIIFFSLLTIGSIVATVMFYNASDKIEEQEIKAAQGVSDLGMALLHARLTNQKPNNSNWSDTEFLKSNLHSILPNTNSYASQIDSQGQLHCCPFNLRIYTNTDLSRFLLIAQPTPGPFYRLIPRSIIVLDSDSMELHAFKDVRIINRLLANSNPLDGANGKEIFTLIKEGKLLRLSLLANESGRIDFAPPKNLAWVKPGAENVVYNAPRYYRFSENFIQRAASLSKTKTSSQEVTTFKEIASNFAHLKNLILYSDSKKSALSARQNLQLFAPSNNFLYGYVQLDNQGLIQQAYLLKPEDFQEANDGTNDNRNEIIALGTNDFMYESHRRPKPASTIVVDKNHPVYIQLNALVTKRENELRPLSGVIYTLLNEELDSPSSHFQSAFQQLYHNYILANNRHQNVIKETITQLYQQYEDMPVDEFMSFINYFQLNQLILEDQNFSIKEENSIQNLESIYQKMCQCSSIAELDNLVHIATTWLNFDHLKDPRELMKYQNLLRNHTLEQLKQFILIGKEKTISENDRENLKHILNQERLIKSDESEYFLYEFEEAITQSQSVS